VPETHFDDEKKTYLPRDSTSTKASNSTFAAIEFQGNTTTRDKVIRREIALEEGNIYNSRLWELSLLRLNQLGYFDQLKPDDPNTTDRKLDEKDGLVDLSLKVHEKGKEQHRPETAASADWKAPSSASIIQANNFLGLGETLSVQASVGNLAPQRAFRIYSSLSV